MAILIFIPIFSIIITALIVNKGKAQVKAFDISAETSCITSSCHTDMGKKRFIHEPARDGEGCSLCHEINKKGEHLFKLQIKPPELCYQCHENKSEKKYKHPPTEAGQCLMCHNPHDSDNPKLLTMPPGDALCFMCHEEKAFRGAIPHGPVNEGKCLECHNPHSTDNPRELVKPIPELCFDCHSTELKDTKGLTLPSTKNIFAGKEMILHKPFAQGKCVDCHYPHPADTYRLVRGRYTGEFYASYSEDAYGFCFSCHPDIKNALKEPRTLKDTKFRNGNLNLHYRHVNKDKGRTCKTCHHHHGSKNQKLIRETFSFGIRILTMKYEKTETGGSCAPTCHAPVQYDRYKPFEITMKTTPRDGKDATPEELELSRQKEMQEIKPGKIN
ncbi:MAG: cytochrome c3 family protein [Nitrospirota bacterium]